ncbi:MAG: formylglycine-generating enzyme family protein [bacterium]|nr:formylglycine-generating enzyme family protein [bacterium]
MEFFKKLFGKKSAAVPDAEFIETLTAKMVEIPDGSFLMGSNDGEDDERPIHNVLIDRYCLSKNVVTQEEWRQVMGTSPWKTLKYIKIADNCPAVNINWYEVRDFIEIINGESDRKFRLPTEAEWEYACRADTSTTFTHGVLKFNLPKYAWFYDNAFKKGAMFAHEVGTRAPNGWGLYDMQGNVYEWCSDWFRRNYYNKSPINNPVGPIYGKYKVVRGGDWARTDYFLRIASRRHYTPHTRDSFLGFRLAMDAPESTAPAHKGKSGSIGSEPDHIGSVPRHTGKEPRHTRSERKNV